MPEDFLILPSTMNCGNGLFANRQYNWRDRILVVDLLSQNEQPINFVNHSCVPNALSLGANVYALNYIFPGQEITIDYKQIVFWHRYYDFQCRCGHALCRGRITGGF